MKNNAKFKMVAVSGHQSHTVTRRSTIARDLCWELYSNCWVETSASNGQRRFKWLRHVLCINRTTGYVRGQENGGEDFRTDRLNYLLPPTFRTKRNNCPAMMLHISIKKKINYAMKTVTIILPFH